MDIRYPIYILTCFLCMSVTASAQQPRPLDSGGMVMSAVNELEAGNVSKSESILDAVITFDSSNDAAWYYKALCALAGKNVKKAEEYFNKAIKLDYGNFWYRYRLACLYAATSRHDLSVDMYEGLLKDFPKKSELYFDLVELYSAVGENEKALETLKEIETVFGMTESIAMYRFSLLMRMKRAGEAYESLEEYNSRYSSPFVLSTLAEHHLSMYEDTTAIRYYDEALELAPDYVPALLGKVEAFRMSKRYDDYFKALDELVANPEVDVKSKTDYISAVIKRSDARFMKVFMPKLGHVLESVIEAYPEDETAQILYLEFLMFVKDYDALLTLCDRIIELAPSDSTRTLMAWSAKGDTYYQLGDVKQSAKAYEQALKINPDYSYVLNNYAYYLSMQGRKLKKACEMSRRTVEAEPDNATYLDTYGWILYLMGRPEEAKPHFKHAMLYGGKESVVILDHYAEVLFALGEYDRAMVYWNQAIRKNNGEIPDLEERVALRKQQMKKKLK